MVVLRCDEYLEIMKEMFRRNRLEIVELLFFLHTLPHVYLERQLTMECRTTSPVTSLLIKSILVYFGCVTALPSKIPVKVSDRFCKLFNFESIFVRYIFT
jgi:hypothetical protein